MSRSLRGHDPNPACRPRRPELAARRIYRLPARKSGSIKAMERVDDAGPVAREHVFAAAAA
jgi:hypothetical protein